jgi:hypothetical protein
MNSGRINSFRVNGATEPTLTFGALSVLSDSPVGYSILRADGTIYNFNMSCWEFLPATGSPTANQLRTLRRFATAGPLSKQQYAAVPVPVFNYSGIWLATFQLNPDGSILSQVDDYPCIPEMFIK